MRRRILVAILGVALAAVVGLGLPLGILGTRSIRSDVESRLDRQADTIARFLADDLARGSLLSTARLASTLPPGLRVTVVQGSTTIVVGDPPPGSVVRGSSSAALAPRVTVETSAAEIERRSRTAWTAVVALVVMVMGGAGILGLRLSRRLAGPVADLAAAAERLGDGDFDIDPASSGVPEVDAAARALASSAARLDDLVRREREFAANAGHQIRTPLAALRLNLEGMAAEADGGGHGEMAKAAAAAIRQTDRLSSTVDELLAAASAPTATAEAVDLAPVVTGLRGRWAPRAEALGRRIVVEAPDRLEIRARPGAMAQALDCLVSNALDHGEGTVRVVARSGAGGVVVSVEDEGSGVGDADAARIFRRGVSLGGGDGIGLALARDLVEGSGGRLVLARPAPPRFDLVLPVPDRGTQDLLPPYPGHTLR